jgi:hypothetical protein
VEQRSITLASALCWLGVGLWLLADAARMRRLAALRRPAAAARALRISGGVLILAAVVPLVRDLGAPLGVAAMLVLAMTVLSLAVVVFPLRPRWYAATLPVALVIALASVICG